jgi:hypothetical protein
MFVRAHPALAFVVAVLVLASVNAFAANLTEFIWSGAVTSGSVRVKARLLADSTQVRLVASTSSTLSNPTCSAYAGASASANDRVAALSLSASRPTPSATTSMQIGDVRLAGVPSN